MDIVGGHQGEVQASGERQQAAIDVLQLRDPRVGLQFQEEAARETFGEPGRNSLRFLHPPLGQQSGDLRRGASGENDQPLCVAFQQGLVDARLIVETL